MVKTLEIGDVTVQKISVTTPQSSNLSDVLFKVKYPKDWKKEKLMPEETVTVSKETAEHFTKLGIGKIL